MKKLSVLTLCALCVVLFASCGKNYKAFVGTWGVEKMIYQEYNIDYAGNPIQGSMESYTYEYDPQDVNNGLQLIFREDKSGEMRDSDIDTLLIVNGNDSTYLACPDTTLVYPFSYSYDENESILWMRMKNTAETFMLLVSELSDNSFVYENNYIIDDENKYYFETAYLKRISNNVAKSDAKGVKKHKSHPRLLGSFLSQKE